MFCLPCEGSEPAAVGVKGPRSAGLERQDGEQHCHLWWGGGSQVVQYQASINFIHRI